MIASCPLRTTKNLRLWIDATTNVRETDNDTERLLSGKSLSGDTTLTRPRVKKELMNLNALNLERKKAWEAGRDAAAQACQDLIDHRPTTERGLLIAKECKIAILGMVYPG